ncbi:MAG TPA: BamA/TamA family outer membrane protein [Myxococcales bacterium]|nr:BamA/TamA family outer membrane protein [Myxococcales bacterium]
MLAALALAAAVAAPVVDWLALPVASYNSDDGLAGGVVVQAQWLGPVAPYKAALGAQVLFTTSGVQSHYLRLDVPRLFGTPLRMWLDGEFHREINAPYYGLGNDSSSNVADHPELFGQHPFTYLRRYPMASIAFTFPFGTSGVRLSAFARYLNLHIEQYDGSLLASEQPPGSNGGEEVQFGFGVLLDRRKGEALPTGGYLLEAALRGSQEGMASKQSYLGGTARAMGFVPLGRRIVLAARIEGDALTPGTPFFELSRFGGVDPVEGVGGERTVRGIPKARFIGRVKLIATTEARIRVADANMFDRRVSFGVVGFYDTGRVWQLQGDDGAFFRFHHGVGGGLRMYHREFVVRLDIGTSSERAANFYLTFGSFF